MDQVRSPLHGESLTSRVWLLTYRGSLAGFWLSFVVSPLLRLPARPVSDRLRRPHTALPGFSQAWQVVTLFSNSYKLGASDCLKKCQKRFTEFLK